MDFELSEDQEALGGAIRSVLEGRLPLDRLRRAEGASVAIDPVDWSVLADAGVFSLLLPESEGGTGLGLADAAVVFEELGRALVPGPLVATLLAAPMVKGAADGSVVVGLAEPPAAGDVVPCLVDHLAGLGALVVLPADSGGLGVVDGDGWPPPATPLVPLDPLTPLWRLDRPLPVGRAVGGPEERERWCNDARVLTAALQVGSARACVELAVAYAGGRNQFGRPIGGFQAVKHICADMLVRAELARSAVHSAALLRDQADVAEEEARLSGLPTAAYLVRSAAGAKLLADKAAIANARSCIQVHGGMGFTWEVPVHLHLKRARVRAASLGSPGTLALTVARLSGPAGTAPGGR